MNSLEAPLPGKVIKINVEENDKVKKGDCLLVIESMKMENSLVAPRDGVVESVKTSIGSLVESGAVLITLEDE